MKGKRENEDFETNFIDYIRYFYYNFNRVYAIYGETNLR